MVRRPIRFKTGQFDTPDTKPSQTPIVSTSVPPATSASGTQLRSSSMPARCNIPTTNTTNTIIPVHKPKLAPLAKSNTNPLITAAISPSLVVTLNDASTITTSARFGTIPSGRNVGNKLTCSATAVIKSKIRTTRLTSPAPHLQSVSSPPGTVFQLGHFGTPRPTVYSPTEFCQSATPAESGHPTRPSSRCLPV